MRKRLGQHFLINKDKLREIVEALELKNGDTVIEIGPGHGELTSEIVSKFQSLKVDKFKVVAIEKDPVLVNKFISLKVDRFKNNVEIIEGDALKILPKIINSILRTSDVLRLKIVGNIPYYITGYLLRILGELESKPFLIVLTIQKEVAERVCALRQAQGKPAMNLLAASVQFWAKPKIIGYISKKDFQPRPEVDSAIITLSPRTNADWTRTNADNYYRLIKILFKQPRKTIINNLRLTTDNLRLLTEKLKALDIDPQSRPQDLSIEQIKELSTLF